MSIAVKDKPPAEKSLQGLGRPRSAGGGTGANHALSKVTKTVLGSTTTTPPSTTTATVVTASTKSQNVRTLPSHVAGISAAAASKAISGSGSAAIVTSASSVNGTKSAAAADKRPQMRKSQSLVSENASNPQTIARSTNSSRKSSLSGAAAVSRGQSVVKGSQASSIASSATNSRTSQQQQGHTAVQKGATAGGKAPVVTSTSSHSTARGSKVVSDLSADISSVRQSKPSHRTSIPSSSSSLKASAGKPVKLPQKLSATSTSSCSSNSRNASSVKGEPQPDDRELAQFIERRVDLDKTLEGVCSDASSDVTRLSGDGENLGPSHSISSSVDEISKAFEDVLEHIDGEEILDPASVGFIGLSNRHAAVPSKLDSCEVVAVGDDDPAVDNSASDVSNTSGIKTSDSHDNMSVICHDLSSDERSVTDLELYATCVSSSRGRCSSTSSCVSMISDRSDTGYHTPIGADDELSATSATAADNFDNSTPSYRNDNNNDDLWQSANNVQNVTSQAAAEAGSAGSSSALESPSDDACSEIAIADANDNLTVTSPLTISTQVCADVNANVEYDLSAATNTTSSVNLLEVVDKLCCDLIDSLSVDDSCGGSSSSNGPAISSSRTETSQVNCADDFCRETASHCSDNAAGIGDSEPFEFQQTSAAGDGVTSRCSIEKTENVTDSVVSMTVAERSAASQNDNSTPTFSRIPVIQNDAHDVEMPPSAACEVNNPIVTDFEKSPVVRESSAAVLVSGKPAGSLAPCEQSSVSCAKSFAAVEFQSLDVVTQSSSLTSSPSLSPLSATGLSPSEHGQSDSNAVKTLRSAGQNGKVFNPVVQAAPVNVVKCRPVAAKEYFNLGSSARNLLHESQSVSNIASTVNHLDGSVVNRSSRLNDAKEISESLTTLPPVMSLSSIVYAKPPVAAAFVSSPHPINQFYGDAGVVGEVSNSRRSFSDTRPKGSTSIRKSFSMRHTPVSSSSSASSTSQDASQILTQINLARSYSRGNMTRLMKQQESSSGGGETVVDKQSRKFPTGVISMLTTDSRSTPRLPTTSDCSANNDVVRGQNVRSPSLYFSTNSQLSSAAAAGLRSTVSSVGLQNLTNSGESLSCETPTASRCASSIFSQDSSTLHSAVSLAVDSESLRGSLTSLASASSSVYSTVEEKQAFEIRKLKHDLEVANEKIESLTSQLNVNSVVVAQYEENIKNLTRKLKQLTDAMDKKDVEVSQLQAPTRIRDSAGDLDLEPIPDCVSLGSFRRKSVQSNTLPADTSLPSGGHVVTLSRHISCESVDSMNSQSSACSVTSQQSAMLYADKKKMKKKNWLRNSFARAFSRNKKNGSKGETGSVNEADTISLQSDTSGLDMMADCLSTPTSHTADCLMMDRPSFMESSRTSELEDRLHERDVELTETRLQSLASHQLIEQLQDTINTLEKEVSHLSSENKNLKRLLLRQGSFREDESFTAAAPAAVNRVSVDGSSLRLSSDLSSRPKDVRLSLNSSAALSGRSPSSPGPRLVQKYSLGDVVQDEINTSSEQLWNIKVNLSTDDLLPTSANGSTEKPNPTVLLIGELSLTRTTGWSALDSMVTDVFMEYLEQLEPGSRLGLDVSSVSGYQLMDVTRMFHTNIPDLLPANYLSDKAASIQIFLKGWQDQRIDHLAVSCLVPKSFLQLYMSLLMESRRLVFSGPSGTGKTFLASQLAKHAVLRCKKAISSNDIVTFTLDAMSVRDLQQYIAHVVRTCESDDGTSASQLPLVIVVDNLQHVSSLSEVFSRFVAIRSPTCPFFIGTMNPFRSPSAADLQLRQNFRWVMLSVSLEPVSGQLTRCLQRKLLQVIATNGHYKTSELQRVINWLMSAWQHVNKFITDTHSSSACIGPGLFMSCPVDMKRSQSWFSELWNSSIIPYLAHIVKDASGRLQNRNSKNVDDPTNWILETYPWPKDGLTTAAASTPNLLRLDLSLATVASSTNAVALRGSVINETRLNSQPSITSMDPLLTMLAKLQESSDGSSALKKSQSNGNVVGSGRPSAVTSLSADLDHCRYTNSAVSLTTVGSAN